MKAKEMIAILDDYVGWHWAKEYGTDFWLQEVLGDFNELAMERERKESDDTPTCIHCDGSGRLPLVEIMDPIPGADEDVIRDRNQLAAELASTLSKLARVRATVRRQAELISNYTRRDLARQEKLNAPRV